jgi:hypothetical protein
MKLSKLLTRGNILIVLLVGLIFWWFMVHDISNPVHVVDSYIKAIIASDTRKIAYLESGDPFAFEKEFGVFSLLLSVVPDANKFDPKDWRWKVSEAKLKSKNTRAEVLLMLENVSFGIYLDLLDKYRYGISKRDENNNLIEIPPTRPDLSYEEVDKLARSESPWIKKTFELTLNKVPNGWIIDSKSAKPLFRYFYPTRDEYK